MLLRLKSVEKTVKGKTNTPYKFDVTVNIPVANRSTDGYKFTIEKTSNESTSSRNTAQIQAVGWFEIKNEPQAYPRTALIGYALKLLMNIKEVFLILPLLLKVC